MAFGSTAVAAAPAARTASPVAADENLGGTGAWAWILGLVILAGVIGVIASDGDEEIPVSP